MPYVRPLLLVRRIVNPITMRFEIPGTRALAVRGRRSGTVRHQCWQRH